MYPAMCFVFLSVCKAVNEEVWFYLLLNLVIVSKIIFSVKLCVSTCEGLGRRTALPGVDSTPSKMESD